MIGKLAPDLGTPRIARNQLPQRRDGGIELVDIGRIRGPHNQSHALLCAGLFAQA
jgi:hypothetical protein